MNKVPVASTEVLFSELRPDTRQGQSPVYCGGKKDGDKGAITIVNAFEGQDAEDIFKLLSTADHEKKPWSEDHGYYRCPYCNSNLMMICRMRAEHLISTCRNIVRIVENQS